MIFEEKLINGAREMGIDLSDRQIGLLRRYYEMVIDKNKVMNLTAITEEDEFLQKHFLDSLSVVKVLDSADLSAPKRVIDVGTGAGFPGIVLKIAFPAWEMILFDSLQKRLTFLDGVIESLRLDKIRTVHGRAEDYGRDKEGREAYDLVVSRAVANLSTLSEYCLPLVRKGGVFVAYKGADTEEEVKNSLHAMHLLGGKIEKQETFTLPAGDLKRTLLKIRKSGQTPAAYPRKAGLPQKDPIR